MTLTIFTPTYNRGSLLAIAYEHLCQQTSKDFIWLIVDDGSSDNTRMLIEQWKQEEIIQIRYYYQSNQGKMRAHNRGVIMADTELFICVDSDDFLVEDGVETICNVWDNLNSIGQAGHLSGIVAYCGRDSTHTMHDEVFPQLETSTLGNLYYKGFSGETSLVYKTEVLKRHLFPEIEGETFVPEAVAYDEIDQECGLYVLPKILTVCKYQENGLTKSIKQLKRKNPKGYLLYYRIKIQITPSSLLRYKYIAHGIRFVQLLNKNSFDELPASKAAIIMAYPGAYILKLLHKL